MTIRFDIARAALLDVGRPDLAAQIRENRGGDPSCPGGIRRTGRPMADSVLIIRAIRLGHQSDPEGAPIGCAVEGGVPACDDGRCPTCLEVKS